MKRWKSEMLQNFSDTWLDGRNSANSLQIRGWTSEMLQIACKTEGLGGTHTMGGGPATRNTAAYIHIYIYIYTYTYTYAYAHTYTYTYTNTYTYTIHIHLHIHIPIHIHIHIQL